jgi:hypothetical protein
MKKKSSVLVIFGGQSGDMKSPYLCDSVIKALDIENYEFETIGISKEGMDGESDHKSGKNRRANPPALITSSPVSESTGSQIIARMEVSCPITGSAILFFGSAWPERRGRHH